MSLATKYRPKKLDDVVGQPTIVRTLSNAWKTKELHQAYLFVGQFGSGKTTTARIVAAMENCSETPGLTPCGKCAICKDIFNGTHQDVQELDAAGNFAKVEQVRQLKQESQYTPTDGAKTKVYIIDECHGISDAGFDSLLKLLEEPPAHCRYILCTSDVQKVRPAVISRCQRHDFLKIYWSQIVEQLEKVCKLEKINVEKGALILCAKLSYGSMRNALVNLEKMITFASQKPGELITSKTAQDLFGSVGESMYYDMFDQILGMKDGKPDATNGFKIINKMLLDGTEFSTIYEGLIEHLRTLMVGMTAASAAEFIVVSDEGKTRLSQQLRKIKETDKLGAVLDSIKMLHEARKVVEYNIQPEVALQHWFVESIFAFRK